MGAAVEGDRDRGDLVSDDESGGVVDELREHAGWSDTRWCGAVVRQVQLGGADDDRGGGGVDADVDRVGCPGRRDRSGDPRQRVGAVGWRVRGTRPAGCGEGQHAGAGGGDRVARGQRVVGRGVAGAVLIDEVEPGSSRDGGVALHIAVQPRDGRVLDSRGVTRVGEAHAVTAAVPQHRGRRWALAQHAVVRDGLVEGEQVVNGALHEQRRDGDAGEEVGGATRREEAQARRADRAGVEAGLVASRDVRVDAVTGSLPLEQAGPAELGGVRLVEAGGERVPGDLGHDRVDPTVDRRGDELDAAPVGPADHPDPRISGCVELGFGAGRDPIEERLHVATLEVRVVDLDGAAGFAEPAGIPGQDVVPGVLERLDGHGPEQRDTRRVRIPSQSPPRTHQHGRGRPSGARLGGGEPVQTDLRPVEGQEIPVADDPAHLRDHRRARGSSGPAGHGGRRRRRSPRRCGAAPADEGGGQARDDDPDGDGRPTGTAPRPGAVLGRRSACAAVQRSPPNPDRLGIARSLVGAA